ncbi:polysaccharide deacetylase family protein [Chengkuizengella axinellae]|uniref:Polysaccharide deacetylase family protein n=1 Tax=Chengkuizengella axinellae TaxID=3064388 RepID=A0ABT9IUA2_9BACL|nr:polysaccharide deacetylase family protein [Chengkuizengella sp. 2205SS18-9]MDP5272929.1 polysaccharide deacetylase family protein [Chengkuizengella sp. 2205SS18-9]
MWGVTNEKIYYVNTNEKLPVLMYHHFSDQSSSTSVKPDDFEQQMKYLKDQGYTTILVSELINYTNNNLPLPDKPVLITMDDGYSSNYEYAYPILKELNMKATFYVVVDQMGETPGVIEHFSWEQAKEMYESGLIDIQSHSYNSHSKETIENKPLLTYPIHEHETEAQYIQRIRQDLLLAKEEIEKNLGNEVISFAYPFGSFNEATEEIAKEVGYQLTLTVRNGINNANDDFFLLNRINVPGGYSGADIVKEIEKKFYFFGFRF